MNIRRLGCLIVVFLLWAVAPAALFGQNVYGKISGVVSDNTGASIGGCALTLTNLDTDESSKVTSDASGNYSFPSISPGRYKIQAEKNGFKIFIREPIIVEIESG